MLSAVYSVNSRIQSVQSEYSKSIQRREQIPAYYYAVAAASALSLSPIMIPITVFTGFLGAGKTSIILSLLPKLPKDYRVVLLKNEYGDVESEEPCLTPNITGLITHRSR